MSEKILQKGTKISATEDGQHKTILLDYTRKTVHFRDHPNTAEYVVFGAFPTCVEYVGLNQGKVQEFRFTWISKLFNDPVVIRGTLFGINESLRDMGLQYYMPYDVDPMSMIVSLFVKEGLLELDFEDVL